MDQEAEKENFTFCHTYPKYVIIIRWIILAAAFALGIYILSDIKEALGVIYVVYSLIALTLILPLSRCVNCFYHGKACNTAWGKVAAYLFRKGDESKFIYRYNYAILLHLLWLIPLFASFLQLLRKKEMPTLVIFLSYLFILLMERVTLKKFACTRCHQREFCPAVPFKKAR
ncbi:MAG: hypothetical protein KAW02_02770 [candidate division Zixibacteria bacterium]|nr:hypothetical protein [candidate division Zixibacteria bacterium]